MPSRLNYRNMVPDDSFIAQYMDAQAESETPTAYDFWCACWLLSITLGRTLRVERPKAPVFLNSYIILVAESGVTRKSTAVRRASEIASEVMRSVAPHMRLVQNATTPLRLNLLMNDLTDKYGTAQVVITAEELVTVLGKAHYSMPGILTDYYDCPSHREGGLVVDKKTGTIANRSIRDVFISVLGASTPTWLHDNITPAVIEGGFTSRCLFIVAEDRKKRIAWPSETTGSEATSRLVHSLGQIRARSIQIRERFGGMPITEGGKAEFSQWYTRRDEHRDPFRASFEAREDHHLLRLAAFLAVSDGRWEIQYDHIIKARKIINAVKEDAAALFARQNPASRAAQSIERIFTRLGDAGRNGLSQAQLGSLTGRFVAAEQMNMLLAIMHEHGYAQMFKIHQSKYGKPLTLWRLTKSAKARGAQAHVLRDYERVISGAESRPTLSALTLGQE